MQIIEKSFGKLWNTPISLFELTNDNGISVSITNYGGIITNLYTPNKNGELSDIVLGFDSLYEYLQGHPFFGAIAGRFANRINKGKFTLNGKSYQLNAQALGHHLHGGVRGFDKYVWQAETFSTDSEVGLVLTHFSPDGDENYPGDLNVKATYTLNKDNELTLTFDATSSEDTIINLVNHSYFNLAGENSGSIENHQISINADKIVEVDKEFIPTGNLKDITNSSLSCTDLVTMKDMFKKQPEEVVDYCYVANNFDGSVQPIAKVVEPKSGRVMEVFTNNVGIQFYNGMKLGDQAKIGKNGFQYPMHAGFCLETQCYPDTPNRPDFPTCVLKKGETYNHVWQLKFNTL